MRTGSIIIGVCIVAIAIAIYITKNLEKLKELLKKLEKKEKLKNFLKICALIAFTVFAVDQAKEIKKQLDYKAIAVENEELFDEVDELMNAESSYYETAMAKKYENQKYNEPYVPEGFLYVEGEWNTGYVIEDESGNQYVWIPCTNEDIEGVVKLEKRDFVSNTLVLAQECYNIEYEEFLDSALENGGFYISRYEIGNDDGTPVSKAGVKVWHGVTRDEAIQVVSNMNTENSVQISIINSFAYDTALQWLEDTNEVEKNKIDVNEEIYTGRSACNNIYDFFDNILEFTLEESYDTIIIRGFAYVDDSSQYNYNSYSNLSRYPIFPEDTYDDMYYDRIGIRTVLFLNDET